MSFWKSIIGSDRTPTVAAIDKALNRARTDRSAAAADLAGLADRRADALLSGDDAAIDTIEAEQTACARRLDQLDLVISRLEARHADAEARENVHQIETQVAEAQAVKARLDKLHDQLTAAATTMARLLGEADDETMALKAFNRRFAEAGRPDLRIKPEDMGTARQHLREYLR